MTLRKFLLLLLMGLCSVMSVAQAAEATRPLEPINRTSPRDTYQSFLAAVQRLEHDYAAYVADKNNAQVPQLRRDLQRIRNVMDLENLPPATRAKIGNAATGYLYDILARLPPLDPGSIPGPAEDGTLDEQKLPSRWTIPGTDIQIARISDGPNTGEYRFTPESIQHLREYYFSIVDQPVLNSRIYPFLHRTQINATGPLIPDALVLGLPEPLTGTYYFDAPLWKILAVVIVILGALLVAALWAVTAVRLSRRASLVGRRWWQLTIPLAILALFSFSEWFIVVQINPAGLFATSESIFVSVVSYLTWAWAAWRFIYFIVDAIISSPRIPENSYDAHLLRLIARIASLGTVCIILINGANEIGIPALGLVAGLGVGGFALALASQSTIENLFGGLSLFADRPFRVGESIKFGDQTAKVERIGPRSSRLRARNGTLCTVPNADLARMHIVNYSMRSQCYMDQHIFLRGDSRPDAVRILLERLRTLLLAEPLLEQDKGWPTVRIIGTRDGHIELWVRANVLTSEYNVFLEIQERILLTLLDMLRELDLKLGRPLDSAAADMPSESPQGIETAPTQTTR